MALPLPVVVAAALSLLPASNADALRTKEFLERYQEGSAPLVSAYEHVRIVASMHDSYVASGRRRNWLLDLLQNGERYKITEYPAPGDTARWRSIDVLTPESQFTLRERDDGRLRRNEPSADAFVDLAQAKDQFRVRTRLLRSPYSFMDLPLSEWLAGVRLSVLSLVKEKTAGRELLRIRFCYEPRIQLQAPAPLRGWFLFEPGVHWALHAFELQLRSREDPVPFGVSGSFAYGAAEGGIPILRTARLQVFGREGALISAERADVQIVRFCSVPREEFTLSGSGYNADAEPPEISKSVLQLLVLVLILTPSVAVVLLVVGRRSRRGAEAASNRAKSLRGGRPAWLLRAAVATAWLASAVTFLCLWLEIRLSVLHPPGLLLLLLIAIGFGASLAGAALGLWSVIRRTNRAMSLALVLVGLFPSVLWITGELIAYRKQQKREVFSGLPMTLLMRAGHALMQTEALYLYPRRLESEHLVMFHDERVSDPQGDLKLMEEYVVHLADMIGKPLRSKIYWVRGHLVGRGGLCVVGMALGSDASPAGQLDRHELAHAVLYQYDSPDTDPPCLLMEGWAECQSTSSASRAHDALAYWRARQAWLEHCSKVWGTYTSIERRDILACFPDEERLEQDLADFSKGQKPVATLRDLTDAYWYHRSDGPVYTVGNGFVDFLIRRYGVPRFVDFYHACRPGKFEAACRQVYGVELDALEKEFWADAENARSRSNQESARPAAADHGGKTNRLP